jgi:hypothetical protein
VGDLAGEWQVDDRGANEPARSSLHGAVGPAGVMSLAFPVMSSAPNVSLREVPLP